MQIMKLKNIELKLIVATTTISAALITGCLTKHEDPPGGHAHKHLLYVAHEGSLSAYDIATGTQEAGVIADVTGPTDMQALADGTVLVNLGTRNEVLAFDGTTMLEKARIPSSTKGASKPTHSFVTPTLNGKTYWMALNDGSGAAATNSALFIDITSGSTDYLKAVGEVGLGVGHHKAAFSKTKQRVVITNISDSSEVMAVFDFTVPSEIKKAGQFKTL
jgi:outer membrane protein assembly factor BamB